MWFFKRTAKPVIPPDSDKLRRDEAKEQAERTRDRQAHWQRAGAQLYQVVADAYEKGVKQAPLHRKIGYGVISAAAGAAVVYRIYVKLHDQNKAKEINLVPGTEEVEVIVGPTGYIVNPLEAVNPTRTSPAEIGDAIAKGLEAAQSVDVESETSS